MMDDFGNKLAHTKPQVMARLRFRYDGMTQHALFDDVVLEEHGLIAKAVYKVLSLRSRELGSLTDTFYIKGPSRRKILNVFTTQYGRMGFVVEVMPFNHPFEMEC